MKHSKIKQSFFFFFLKKKQLFVLLFLILFIGFELTQFKKTPTVIQASKPLGQYASEVLQKCKSASSKQTCYEKEVPKLMEVISMEDAFKVTRIIQDKDTSYTFCHVLGHKLSAKEIDKDPSKWKDVVSRCPSGECSNGCIHGGFQEKFRAENLTDAQVKQVLPDIKTICEERPSWHPTGLEQASCYHALGHLTMYLTQANVKKATDMCEQVALKTDGRDFRQVCYDGSFMQIYQPLEPEDFALIKGKEQTKNTVAAFCNEYDGQKRGSCISESWPLFDAVKSDPNSLVTFCSQEAPEEKQRCYHALFFVITVQFGFDLSKIKTYCSGLPRQTLGLCFADASARMIETDYRNVSKSVEFCKESLQLDSKGTCFNTLITYATFNFHKSSPEARSLCEQMPAPWKENCLAKL